MELEDISPDGKVLVNVKDERREMTFSTAEHRLEREVSWLHDNALVAISDDGRQVLFTAFQDGTVPSTYVRPGDGSPALKLGPGEALAFSPDEKWVLVEGPLDPSILTLLPVGVGVPEKLPTVGLNVGSAQWLRDGKRLVVTAQRKGDKQWRLFVVPLDGGEPTPLSDSPIMPDFLAASRDDRFAAVVGLDGTLTVFPLDGSPPLPVPELGRFSSPAGWTSDGQLWVSDSLSVSGRAQSHLRRYDIPSRRVVEERTFVPAELTGLFGRGLVRITPDSRAVAFDYLRKLSNLYVLNGLAPPRR